MKVSVFTGDQPRHVYLLNKIAQVADQCTAVIERSAQSRGTFYSGNEETGNARVFVDYFQGVKESEWRIIGDNKTINPRVSLITLTSGDLSVTPISKLRAALDSDVYIVFGSSHIKGWLSDYLVQKRAINIHMGVSPYYRGSSCNFWATYDFRPAYVGATVHLLSKGLDSGNILYHVLPDPADCSSQFDFGMKAVRAAIDSVSPFLERFKIGDYSCLVQDRSLELRYSRKQEFTEEVAKEFLSRDFDQKIFVKLVDEGRKNIPVVQVM